MVGTNATAGKKLLNDANILTLDTLTNAAKKAVEISNGGANEHSGQ
jgi:succinyl-CoA synthetase beta subunit